MSVCVDGLILLMPNLKKNISLLESKILVLDVGCKDGEIRKIIDSAIRNLTIVQFLYQKKRLIIFNGFLYFYLLILKIQLRKIQKLLKADFVISPIKDKSNDKIIQRPPGYNLFRFVTFLYSLKVCKEVFKVIQGDWQEEYFEALSKKEIWKARWINVRYTYAFLAAMWMKSPIGDLIQFVIKIAKP